MITRIAGTWSRWLTPARERSLETLGLLVLRLAVGPLMFGLHGMAKLSSFSDLSGSFPDPLGVGSAVSLTLAVFAEAFCSVAVALGLFTRLAAVPLAFTMGIAAFVVHAADPWEKKELALLYLAAYLVLLLCGPGRLSVDAALARSREQ